MEPRSSQKSADRDVNPGKVSGSPDRKPDTFLKISPGTTRNRGEVVDRENLGILTPGENRNKIYQWFLGWIDRRFLTGKKSEQGALSKMDKAQC